VVSVVDDVIIKDRLVVVAGEQDDWLVLLGSRVEGGGVACLKPALTSSLSMIKRRSGLFGDWMTIFSIILHSADVSSTEAVLATRMFQEGSK